VSPSSLADIGMVSHSGTGLPRLFWKLAFKTSVVVAVVIITLVLFLFVYCMN